MLKYVPYRKKYNGQEKLGVLLICRATPDLGIVHPSKPQTPHTVDAFILVLLLLVLLLVLILRVRVVLPLVSVEKKTHLITTTTSITLQFSFPKSTRELNSIPTHRHHHHLHHVPTMNAFVAGMH